MTINYEILSFPSLPIQGQLFRAPGQAYDGGFSAGGARISSPEPGGRAYLDVQLSLQTNEWFTPWVSWLMSKLNGDIFSIPLAKTPQLFDASSIGIINASTVPWEQLNINSQPTQWDNNQLWSDDGIIYSTVNFALEGSNVVKIEIDQETLRVGHVIGFGLHSYMIDAIDYNAGEATIRVKPPLRKDIPEGEYLLTRPYFLGQIINGQEFSTNYEAINNGHIQPPRLIFGEVII